MKLEIWRDWTAWHSLRDLSSSGLEHKPASYMIAAHTKIHRAVGIDNEGILTIGKASSLRQRLSQFKKCAAAPNGTLPGHMAGWRFSFHNMTKHFPFAGLQVCWRLFDTPDQAADEEARLLTAYIGQHLEQPPLNYSASWRMLSRASKL